MITTIFLILAIILTTSTYIKTRKISRLSAHQGIRLTNQAFLFFAIAYTIAFITSTTTLPFFKLAILKFFAIPIQTYLLTLAALYLAVSLFWKNSVKDVAPLHIIALLTLILNNFTNILPLTLTAIYSITAIKSYENYTTKKTIFSQSHLIAISLLALANLIIFITFQSITSQAMTLTAFSIFLYGTLKTIK